MILFIRLQPGILLQALGETLDSVTCYFIKRNLVDFTMPTSWIGMVIVTLIRCSPNKSKGTEINKLLTPPVMRHAAVGTSIEIGTGGVDVSLRLPFAAVLEMHENCHRQDIEMNLGQT